MKNFVKKDPHLVRLLVIMVIVLVLMAVLKPNVFFSAANFKSMAVQFPELGFLSIAAAMVMMSGGIDLSVTGTAVLSGIVAARIMVAGKAEDGSVAMGTIVFAVIAALIVGLLCGTLNAVLVAKIGITPMLVTLGTMNLYAGIGIVLTKGSAISGFPETFLHIGNGEVLGIPIPLFLFVIGIIVFWLFLNRTKMGYKLAVYGSNPIASLFSAINNTKVVLSTFIMSGFISSIAGIIMISRTNTAKGDYGSSYGLQAMLVAVLGGVDPAGGTGKAVGILIAIFTLQMLSSGFNLLHVSPFLKDFTWGALLVFVMALNVIKFKKKQKKGAENE